MNSMQSMCQPRFVSSQQQHSSSVRNISPESPDLKLNNLISKLKTLSGPIVLVWLPDDEENPFGHVALLTNLYYISFWPFKGKHGYDLSKSAVDGCLHFHVKEDFEAEGNREPSLYQVVNVTNEQINAEYVKFLNFNGINPEEVSLAAAENKTECRKELTRTCYSFIGNLIVEKGKRRNYSELLFCLKRCLTQGWENNTFCPTCKNQSGRVECPFYHRPQSCVSFCFNLIEMADPNPLVCLIEAHKNNSFLPGILYSSLGICLEITVPNFEEYVVKKYWLKGCERKHYNVLDFQKRSHLLMLAENVFKNTVMKFPSIIAIKLLHDTLFDWPWYVLYPVLCVSTSMILLIYFVLFYCVRVGLFPTVRLPKNFALISGVFLFLFMLILFCFSVYLFIWIPILNFFIFFIFVQVSEFFMRKYLDDLMDIVHILKLLLSIPYNMYFL